MYGIEAEDFLILNPLLYSDLDKYIWISDSYEEHRSAQQMFDYLMKRNIYVKGFATNVQSIFHLKMYNKTILDVDTLDRKKNIVFFDTCLGKSDNYVTYNGEWDRIINPNIDKKDVVIWGAGVTGKYACKILVENGIRVKCFVDSNKKAEDTEKCGLQICSPEQLDEFGKDVTVIEALEKWQQLDACIQKKYERRFHFSLRNNIWDKITCNVEGVEKNIFCLADFWMFSRFIDKKIYIYGNGVIEKEFAKYLRLMDYDFGGFLVDEIEQGDNENKYPIQYVEEILYEKDYYIWVYENKRVQKLRALGLQYFKEYECNLWNWDITNGRKNVLDVNLGYNYTFNGKYPGIMVYGKENENDYRIAVLGGSTTDGAMYPFRSWPSLLYDALAEYGVTIYNGGVCGYTSCQELLKLLRDMLALEPDMIIVYDGFNDYYANAQYPFAINYARQVYDYANGNVEDELVAINTNQVCLGIESYKNQFDNWLSNIRSMYAIASERNISFFSFCQPWFISKKINTVRERSLLLSMQRGIAHNFAEGAFRNYMSQMTELPAYIYDLSHIFDHESDVYMDICHVWEKGNEIIAKEIEKVILPQLNESLIGKKEI